MENNLKLGFRSTSVLFAMGIIVGACSSDSNNGGVSNPSFDPNVVHPSFGSSLNTSFPTYALTTQFRGEGFVLSIVQLENGDFSPRLVAKQNAVAENWVITSNGDNTFSLANVASGKDFQLDVVNNDALDSVKLATTAEVSGQKWTFTQLDNGYCRLTNDFTGSEVALDIENEGDMTVPKLTAVGDFSGQNWTVQNSGGASTPTPAAIENCLGALEVTVSF